MTKPTSKLAPPPLNRPHRGKTDPTEPVRAVELSYSEYESIEEDAALAPTLLNQACGATAQAEGSQTCQGPRPVAALSRRSRVALLAVLVVTLCATATGGALAYARSSSHRSEPVAKSAPTTTSAPAHDVAHPALKKKSTTVAKHTNVRSNGSQAGRAPSSHGSKASDVARGKTKQPVPAAARGKNHPTRHASGNGKQSVKTAH